jgi:ABC-2 type transport system permease protein
MLKFSADFPPINCVVVSYDSNVVMFNGTEYKNDNYTIPYIEAVNESQLVMLEFMNATEDLYAMETARNMLLRGDISVIVAIPIDFSELLDEGYPAIIEAVPDSSDIGSIQLKLNAVFESVKIFVHNNNLTPYYTVEGYEEFEIPEGYSLKYNFNVTLMLSFISFGIALVLTILSVVQEKPIARLLLTPARRVEILVAKIITYTSVLVIQVGLVILATMLNGLYLQGGNFVLALLKLFIALFLVSFCGMSLGLFISCLSKTKTEANQYFFAFFIVIVILSGIFIPIDAMPRWLQFLAKILPLSHGDPMLRGIITKGSGLFGPDFLALLGISGGLIILSFVLIMRRRYEV